MIVNVKGLEPPPPGTGLDTVTEAEPATRRSLAGIEAVSLVEPMKVVGRSEPFHRTTELRTKFEPLTVSVKAEPPVVRLLGERELMIGTGFGAERMKKGRAAESPPPGPGLKTRTEGV